MCSSDLGVSSRQAHGSDLILFALTGATFVRVDHGDAQTVAELGPEDAMYVPMGASYDVRNVGAATCRLIFGVAPNYLT